MKVEHGVQVMKNGKAWGVVYSDGRETNFGWLDPEDAPIHSSEHCQHPTDVTWLGSPYVEELSTAEIVPVKRTTSVEFL